MTASYVYVASSWRCTRQPEVIEAIRGAGIDCYDFRNPPDSAGFGWEQTGSRRTAEDAARGILEPVDDYLAMVEHPVAVAGFDADFAAMKRADAFVLVLPCGKSAHLELGWAVGAGRRTAILLEDFLEPELMYRMASKLARSIDEVLEWLERLPTTVFGLEIVVDGPPPPGIRFDLPAAARDRQRR